VTNPKPTVVRRELLSRREAAAYLGVAEQTLAVWKSTRRYDVTVVQVGRLAKYDRPELHTWLVSRTTGRPV
jgi:hypothetical protein